MFMSQQRSVCNALDIICPSIIVLLCLQALAASAWLDALLSVTTVDNITSQLHSDDSKVHLRALAHAETALFLTPSLIHGTVNSDVNESPTLVSDCVAFPG